MIALDTSFLIDYLDGEEAAGEFLRSHDGSAFVTPSLALFEVYRGVARSGGRERIDDVAAGLDWVDPLPLTDETAREAAVIEAELREAGEPVNLGDILIAGICRANGATLATADDHFEHVGGLDTLDYRVS